jgi:hypothetical protein
MTDSAIPADEFKSKRLGLDEYQAFTNDSLTMVYEGSATAVIVLRHGAFPIALGNEMW